MIAETLIVQYSDCAELGLGVRLDAAILSVRVEGLEGAEHGCLHLGGERLVFVKVEIPVLGCPIERLRSADGRGAIPIEVDAQEALRLVLERHAGALGAGKVHVLVRVSITLIRSPARLACSMSADCRRVHNRG